MSDYTEYDPKKTCSYIWSAGYSPRQLLSEVGSSTNSVGLLADLVFTRTTADWEIADDKIFFQNLIPKPAVVFQDWNATTLSLPEDENESLDIKTTREKIIFLKESFGISHSQLAKILRASRPRVYSWLEGEEPRDTTAERILHLYQIATQWDNINDLHFSSGSVFGQPLGANPSILTTLSEEILNHGEIKKALSLLYEIMKRKREKMDEVKERTKKTTLSEAEARKNREFLTGSVGSSTE